MLFRSAAFSCYINAYGDYTWTGVGIITPMVGYGGTQTLGVNGGALGTGFLFDNQAILSNGGAARTSGPFYTLNAAPNIQCTGITFGFNAAISNFPTADIRVVPTFTSTGTGALSVGNHTNIQVGGILSSSSGNTINVASRKGINIEGIGVQGTQVLPTGSTVVVQQGLCITPLIASTFSSQITLGVTDTSAIFPAGITGTWAMWQQPTGAGFWNLEAAVIPGLRPISSGAAGANLGARTDMTILLSGTATGYTLPTLAVLIAAAQAGHSAYTASQLAGLTITVIGAVAVTVVAGTGIAFHSSINGTITAGTRKSYTFDGTTTWY